MTAARKPRWWMLGIILALFALVQIILRVLPSEDASLPAMVTWLAGIVTFLLLLVWLFGLSRLPWKTRWKIAGGVALVVAGFFTLFRSEGLGGDMVPQFGFRFAKTSEELAASRTNAAEGATPGGRLEVTDSDWPSFRGPERDGKASAEVVRTDWKENPPQTLWRHAVGPAWTSFTLVGDFAFTQEQRGENEVTVAYEAKTGEEIWTHSNTARHDTFLGGAGPRATPTFYDSRLYALGATGILDCLDPVTGKLLWSRDIVQDAATQILEFGFAGSPLVYDDVVVVNPGKNVLQGEDASIYDGTTPGALIAYHRLTGDIVWRTGQRKAGYAAPRLETIDGRQQILLFSAWGLAGHDPQNGEELWFWELTNPYGTNSVQPIFTRDGDIFLSTEGTGSVLLDVNSSGDTWTVEPLWETARFVLRFNGGVLDDNHVYGLDKGILAALDLETGERAWKKGRYKFGQVLLLRDYLLVLSEKGDVALVDISPEGMTEIARFHAIDGRCWNHPVVRDGILYVRSDEEAAAYDLRPPTT